MKIKRISYFIVAAILSMCYSLAFSQIKNDTFTSKQKDTTKILKKKVTDTLQKNKKAGPFKINAPRDTAVLKDTGIKKAGSRINNDSTSRPMVVAPIDTSKKDSLSLVVTRPADNYRTVTSDLLLNNRLINFRDAPVYFIQDERKAPGKEFLFYALSLILLILGVFKTFYNQYFNNLFRVFFNTSLRQSQLTDQLLQAKLPSFILNIFFMLSTGIYIYLLFTHFHPPRLISSKLLLPFCILSVVIIYFIKYCLLKFIGWVSDLKQATDNYIFVIFLINKITGIVLVPFIIILAFSIPLWINTVAIVSLLVIALFFLSRYIKSYGAINRKLPLNPFHFLLYILGIEIIPLMLIYKVAVDYLI